MARYSQYTTTIVRAHSVPRWYEALDRLVTLGQLSPADFADAQFRAGQAAILEQEVAGIDVITGGEMHWPPLCAKCDAEPFLAEDLPVPGCYPTKAKQQARSQHLPSGAICRAAITETTDLGLVDEFRMVSAFVLPASLRANSAHEHRESTR